MLTGMSYNGKLCSPAGSNPFWIALLHRLGLEFHKPDIVPRKLNKEKQQAFIEDYEKLLNSLGEDKAVLRTPYIRPMPQARIFAVRGLYTESFHISRTAPTRLLF